MEAPICPLKLRKNSPLINNILEKHTLLQSHDPKHKKYKTALIIEGGIMLGVYAGGVMTGLEDLGLSNVFDFVVGISAGAGIGAYLLGGNAKLGNSIFYEDLNDSRFINPLRYRNILNLDYLEELLRVTKPVNIDKVRQSRTELLIPVTDIHTGLGEIMSSKNEEIDLILALKAAMSVPILYKKGVTINNRHYCDGNMALPNAIEYTIRELHCTDIVVITNRSCDCNVDSTIPSFSERFIASTLMRHDTLGFKQAFMNREPHYRHDMGLLWKMENTEKVELGLICRNKMPISRFSKNAKKLKEVAKSAEEQTINLFS